MIKREHRHYEGRTNERGRTCRIIFSFFACLLIHLLSSRSPDLIESKLPFASASSLSCSLRFAPRHCFYPILHSFPVLLTVLWSTRGTYTRIFYSMRMQILQVRCLVSLSLSLSLSLSAGTQELLFSPSSQSFLPKPQSHYLSHMSSFSSPPNNHIHHGAEWKERERFSGITYSESM